MEADSSARLHKKQDTNTVLIIAYITYPDWREKQKVGQSLF